MLKANIATTEEGNQTVIVIGEGTVSTEDIINVVKTAQQAALEAANNLRSATKSNLQIINKYDKIKTWLIGSTLFVSVCILVTVIFSMVHYNNQSIASTVLPKKEVSATTPIPTFSPLPLKARLEKEYSKVLAMGTIKINGQPVEFGFVLGGWDDSIILLWVDKDLAEEYTKSLPLTLQNRAPREGVLFQVAPADECFVAASQKIDGEWQFRKKINNTLENLNDVSFLTVESVSYLTKY